MPRWRALAPSNRRAASHHPQHRRRLRRRPSSNTTNPSRVTHGSSLRPRSLKGTGEIGSSWRPWWVGWATVYTLSPRLASLHQSRCVELANLVGFPKRYIYPIIAPPTPERLEQDKKIISDQFEKTFALVEQLGRDTEALKAAEQDRTERLDTALSELESTINDLKTANRRREDDSQRIRDEIQNLKESLPAALESQKSVADSRLKEVNAELLSLKTLISRMNASSPATPPAGPTGFSRTASGNVNGTSIERTGSGVGAVAETTEAGSASPAPALTPSAEPAKGSGRTSPTSNGASGKVSIPAWQLAMANKGEAEAGGSS